MVQEEFNEFVGIEIPQALFHVMPSSIDSEVGCKSDEKILVEMISSRIECLKFKPLQWFLDSFLYVNDNFDKVNRFEEPPEDLFYDENEK